jgi:hypothetical protein
MLCYTDVCRAEWSLREVQKLKKVRSVQFSGYGKYIDYESILGLMILIMYHKY